MFLLPLVTHVLLSKYKSFMAKVKGWCHTPRRANQENLNAHEKISAVPFLLRGSWKNSRKEPLTHNEHFWGVFASHTFFWCERVSRRASQKSHPHHIPLSQFCGKTSRASPALSPPPFKTTPHIFLSIGVFKVQSRGHSGWVKTVLSYKRWFSH